MENLSFSGKIIKIGGSYGVVIPKAFIGMLETDKKYYFVVSEYE